MSTQPDPNATNEFLAKFEERRALSGQLGQACALKSKQAFGDNLLQPMHLCDATIDFISASLAEGHKISGENLVLKMQLLACYIQSMEVATSLIMEGNYIKAAAALKQDFEIMVAINEINNGRHQHGKTPHAQNGPPSFREMNGYLNDIAHISKEDVLFDLLKHIEKGKFKGISSTKKFNKKPAIRMITYNISIKVELCRQALNLYLEIAGEDDRHAQALRNYQLINQRYQALGLFE